MLLARFECKGVQGGVLAGPKSACRVFLCMCGWMRHSRVTTRVTLDMMEFAGREVGRSAKSFEVPHVSSTHRLRAKGSRDASLRVESTRACGVSAVVCVGAPLRARVTHEITHLDGRAVGGAPPRVAHVV